MNNPTAKSDKISSAGLRLVKTYIATALVVWKVMGFLITGAEGLSSAFSASPLSLAIGGGYVLAVGILLAHAFLQFKRRQYQGLTGTLVFAGLGMLFLVLGADLSFDSVSFIGSLIALGMIGLMAYYSWKGMRYFKSRAFLYWFWGYLITLAGEIGMRFGYAAGPPPPGAVEHAGWFWNLVQNAGLSSLHAEWFLELYWLGQIVAGVLIAAGMILLVRQSGPEGSQPLSVNTARYVALGVLFMLLGIYPSLAFFESPGFVTTCVVNAVVLWYALSACRRPNGTCFELWAWAAGVTLLLTAASLFHRAWEYPPRGSDLMILKLTVMGGLVAGFLRVAGLMVALRQPPAAKSPDEPRSETVSKVSLLPRPPSGMKRRLVIILGVGGLAVGMVWLSQHDPSQVFSSEPKYQGHTVSYWVNHWHVSPDYGNGNVEAQAAIRSMGAKAVPILLPMIGNRSGDPMQALVCIGAEAAPGLANKLLETLADTNPPIMNWRNPRFEKSAFHVQECVIEILSRIGANAEAATPALIQAMKSTNEWTQAEAAGAVASVGKNQPDTVIPALIESLNNSATAGPGQGAVAVALGSIGGRRPEIVIPVLIKVLTNAGAEPMNQAAAAGALASLGKDQPDIIVPVLLGVFTNIATHLDHPPAAMPDFMFHERFYRETPFPDFNNSISGARAEIADALAAFGKSARLAVPDLLLAGESTNADLRAHAALAVHKISPETPHALAPLIKNLTDRDVFVREQALRTLESLGTNAAEALPTLTTRCLHDPMADVRMGAMSCIASIGNFSDETISALGENAGSFNENVAQQAVRTLAGFANRSKPAFLELVKAKSSSTAKDVRDAAKYSLEALLDKDPAMLVACLEDTNSQIRFQGLQIVSGYETILPSLPQPPPAVRKALHDDNPEARSLATNMLIQIDSESYGRPVAELLVRGGDINATNGQGQTVLHLELLSPGRDGTKAIREFLDAGANPNARDNQGRTPAHLLLTGKWFWPEVSGMLSLLVSRGADLSETDNSGQTPLHYWAALGGPSVFVQGIEATFLAAKVDFQLRDEHGDTPLHIAARTGTRDVFSWLVKQGADMDATNNAGETPRLISAHLPSTPWRDGPVSAETDILQVARAGNLEAATKLLEADRKLVNQTNVFGQTPLLLAVQAHRTNMVELLEKYGAPWDAESAIVAGRVDVLREILRQRPAAVSTKAISGGSLLHSAVQYGNVEIIKTLLAAKPDMQAVDMTGLSPLSYALASKRTDIAELLLQHGAKESFLDAVYNDDVKTASALLARDKSLVSATNLVGSVTELTAGMGYADILRLLLDQGAPVDAANAWSAMTPLYRAVMRNQTNTAQLLLQRGAKLEVYDRSGFTPLHYAASQGSIEMAALLLQNKANPDTGVAPSSDPRPAPGGATLAGDAALHFAALRGDTNLIQLLLKSGASVNLANSTGRTPLDLASQPGLPMEFYAMQPGILRLFEPSKTGELVPANPMPLLMERQKAGASLLEASGGKRSSAMRGIPAPPRL